MEQMLRDIDVNLITTNWQSNALKTKKMHKRLEDIRKCTLDCPGIVKYYGMKQIKIE